MKINKLENKIDELEKKVADFDELEKKVNDFEKLFEEQKTKIKDNKDVINSKENTSREISEKLTKFNEIVDSFESIADEQIKALETKMKVQNRKYTEQCVKFLAVKVDEICLGLGSQEIEEEILDFFVKEEHEVEDQADDKEELEDQDTTDPLDQTFLNPSLGFSCKKCDIVGKNAGLKTHIKRRHKTYD